MEGFFFLVLVILIIVLITRAGTEERKRVEEERSRYYKSTSIKPISNENKFRDYPIATTNSSAITKKTCLKTIKGTTLFEGAPVEYGGTLPNYVYKALSNGEIRVNCLTHGDIFLRSDGTLFHIQPNWGIWLAFFEQWIGPCTPQGSQDTFLKKFPHALGAGIAIRAHMRG